MQAHTKEMNDKEQLFPSSMIIESQVSGLAKLELGKLAKFWLGKWVNIPNFD